jgi:FMN reductase
MSRQVNTLGTAIAPAAAQALLPTAALVGNPRTGSRTLTVARHVVDLIHEDLRAHGVPLAVPDLVDLADIGPELARWEDESPRVRVATAAVRAARLLVVASPTFKASYAGLLKLFLDRLPRQALAGVTAVPVMTAASSAHAFAVDTCLRPVLVELGATVPVSGLTVLEADFGSVEAVVRRWRAAATPVLAAVLTR